MTTHGLSRRHALSGAAAVGVGAPLLAACGTDEGSTAADSGGDAGDPGSTGRLATTSEVEVGGGTVFAEQKVVVTQPTEGDFRAFSSTCPHQGCQVSSVSDGTINCPCHGSKFSVEDGSVTAGPATTALAAVEIDVQGDDITLA